MCEKSDIMMFIVPLLAEAAPKLPCGFIREFGRKLREIADVFPAVHSWTVANSAVRYCIWYDMLVSDDGAIYNY